MKKILEKIFRGYTVLEEVDSPINGKIRVLEDIFGKRRLVVGGLTQSGEAVEKIWQKAIKELKNSKTEKQKNVLILGLGAGSAAKLVSRFFPGLKIVGVEIDPEIIRLGKKYFGLSEIKNLKIKTADALLCINELIHCNRRFNLVLVDLYVGDQLPKEVEKDQFLKKAKKVLESDGIVIFNRLYYREKIKETDNFEKKLEKIFSKVEVKKSLSNILFLCQNKDSK